MIHIFFMDKRNINQMLRTQKFIKKMCIFFNTIKHNATLYKDLLKNVTLYKLYDTFEHELKSNPEFGKCNEQCGAKLKGVSTEESKLLKLCKIICNVILNVIDSNGLYKGLSCSGSNIYMNIWLYEQVKKIKAKDYEINNFYDALVSIMKIRKSELKNCSIINFHEKKNEYTNMKYLFEFLHIYEDIQKEITADLSAKDQLYCTYIRDFFKYYNSIEGSCRSTGTRPIYCGVIGKYRSTLIGTHTLDSVHKKCNFDKITCEGDSSVKPDFPCLKMKENLFKNESQSDYKKNIVSMLHTALIPFISILGTLLIFYKVNMIYFLKY
ncbi:hypothetical protein PVMG_05978 [Plasmodium vivax Mauritania I]|uniref:Uncharacterized protein n=1 Tax=Plasmodium vivax Mauritania I TaxID=1035515 RepID=A0A0J9TJ38_PLAVI|nr:hypothetical protein PVMG_05978 [Plasmodium vivax Mauritania I]